MWYVYSCPERSTTVQMLTVCLDLRLHCLQLYQCYSYCISILLNQAFLQVIYRAKYSDVYEREIHIQIRIHFSYFFYSFISCLCVCVDIAGCSSFLNIHYRVKAI